MRKYSNLTGKTGVTGVMRCGIHDSSELSPLQTTDYRGDEIFHPDRIQSTMYERSVVAFPPSTIPQDSLLTPRVSVRVVAQKNILGDKNVSQYVGKNEQEEGVKETRKVYTPIPRKFETSSISGNEDEKMTEEEPSNEEPYMTPTNEGKNLSRGKGVKRPVMLK